MSASEDLLKIRHLETEIQAHIQNINRLESQLPPREQEWLHQRRQERHFPMTSREANTLKELLAGLSGQYGDPARKLCTDWKTAYGRYLRLKQLGLKVAPPRVRPGRPQLLMIDTGVNSAKNSRRDKHNR